VVPGSPPVAEPAEVVESPDEKLARLLKHKEE
jgi:hypothetical protein